MNHGIAVSLSVTSLTLVVAATAMWVRSNDTEDDHRYISQVAGHNTYLYFVSHSGQLAIKITPQYPSESPDQLGVADWRWCREYEQRDRLFADVRSWHGAAGVGIQAGEDVLFDYLGESVTCRGYALIIPHGGLALMFAVLLARCLIRDVRRRYRRAKSLCVGCGYDLRASSGRCPECGRTFASHRARRCAASSAESKLDAHDDWLNRARTARRKFGAGRVTCRDLM